MSEWLLFPVLEIILPIMEILSLPNWLICVGAFVGGAFFPVSWTLIIRWYHNIPLRWYECLWVMVPMFVWGLSILSSRYQVVMTGWSFYAGALSAVPLFLSLAQARESFVYQHLILRADINPNDLRWMSASLFCLAAIFPILAAAFGSASDFGVALTWIEYFESPQKLALRQY